MASMITPSRRRIFRFLALLLVPALLVAAEIALRIRQSRAHQPLGTSVWSEPDDHLGYRLRRDYHTPDGRAYLNADGFRGDSLHLVSSPGSPRIVVVGNSCVFGAGIEDPYVFETLLERKLRATGAESAIVYNAGVGGYNSNQCRLYLERELWNLRPDTIILYVGWNDLVTATWPFFAENLQLGPAVAPRSSSPWDWLEHSKLFWSLRSRWRSLSLRLLRPDRGLDVWNEQAIANYRENLDAIRESCEKRGVGLLFCLLPHDPARLPPGFSQDSFRYTPEGMMRLVARFQEEIRSAAGPHPVVDLPKAIAGLEHREDVIYDYNHLGIEGHRLVADALFEALRP